MYSKRLIFALSREVQNMYVAPNVTPGESVRWVRVNTRRGARRTSTTSRIHHPVANPRIVG
jgi:hypothetical protein